MLLYVAEDTGKVLTVAVPAYNSQQYLHKCLDSLCQPAFLERLEIIVVNDGSTDGTSALAHSYAERYLGSLRVIDKENGGHGSGINVAAAQARGRYFQVVDSDDWVVSDNMPALLEELAHAQADMVLCHFHMVDMHSGKKQAFRTEGIPLGTVYSFSDFMHYPRDARTCCFFHGLIYRTEFYRSTGIRLSEKVFYEDQEYATLPAYYAKTILPLDLYIYQYMVGNASQSISNENQVRNMGQIEFVFWKICRFYCARREMPAEKREYFLFKMSALLLSYYVAGLLKDRDRKRGKLRAVRMSQAVQRECPELYTYSRKKYRIARALHALHISADTLEQAKRTKLYYKIRKYI